MTIFSGLMITCPNCGVTENYDVTVYPEKAMRDDAVSPGIGMVFSVVGYARCMTCGETALKGTGTMTLHCSQAKGS